MPRFSFASGGDEFAKAGGLTQARMMDDVRTEQRQNEAVARDERRYQDTLARQSATDARAMRYEERADTREERILRSQELDDRLKKARLDRELAEEINAKERAIIDEDRAVKAGKELFDIDTKGADAEKRLSEVYRDYGDLIGDEKRFPRLRGQWDFNNKNFTFHRTEAEKAAAAAQKQRQLEDAVKAGMVRESVTVDGERYALPDSPKPVSENADSYEAFQRDITAARKTHGVPIAKDGGAQASLPDAIQKQFEERGARLSGSAKTAIAPVIGGIAPPPATSQPAFGAGGTIVVPPAAAPATAPAAVRWTRDASGNPIPAP